MAPQTIHVEVSPRMLGAIERYRIHQIELYGEKLSRSDVIEFFLNQGLTRTGHL